jgi:hypothetical protein
MDFDPQLVEACLASSRLRSRDFAQPEGWERLRCPTCQAEREQLTLLWWQSDMRSWRGLAGRAGPLLWCSRCQSAVRFRLQLLN